MSVGTDEIELKARVDDPAALEAALVRSGARLLFRGTMLDCRYDRRRRLRGRDQVLRLRAYRADDGRSRGVLAWKGPVDVRSGYKHREEHETEIADAGAAHAILTRLGYEVVLRIDRTIAEYAPAGARATVRIEWYPAMDVLVEIEGEPDAIEQAIAVTGLPRDRFSAESLPHFVAEYERRTGHAARLAAEPVPSP